MIQLLDALRECNLQVTKLSLTKNLIDDSCVFAFGKYFEKNNALVSIHLGWNEISDSFIQQLVPFLNCDTKLEAINLNGNRKITNKSIPCFIDLLINSHIRDIDHSSTSIYKDIDFNMLTMHKLIKSNKSAINFFGW